MRHIVDAVDRAATARGASLALHLMDLCYAMTAEQMAERGVPLPPRVLDAPVPLHDDIADDPLRTAERLVARTNPYFARLSFAADAKLARWTENPALAHRFADRWAAGDAIRTACSPSGEFDAYLDKYYALTRVDGSLP